MEELFYYFIYLEQVLVIFMLVLSIICDKLLITYTIYYTLRIKKLNQSSK